MDMPVKCWEGTSVCPVLRQAKIWFEKLENYLYFSSHCTRKELSWEVWWPWQRKNSHGFHSFIHSIGMCRMWQFCAVLRSFFHSSLSCSFSCHPSPPTIRPSPLTSSCHLFLGLPHNLVPKFIYNGCND